LLRVVTNKSPTAAENQPHRTAIEFIDHVADDFRAFQDPGRAACGRSATVQRPIVEIPFEQFPVSVAELPFLSFVRLRPSTDMRMRCCQLAGKAGNQFPRFGALIIFAKSSRRTPFLKVMPVVHGEVYGSGLMDRNDD
jgi:hypothetical protein